MSEYMAAGRRHGGEVRERRESHRNGEYEYDRTRNGYGDYGRGGGKDSRVRDGRVRVVRRDSRSRSNSASGDVSRLCELSIGAMDREPGELSTESGSDESIGSESRGISKNASKLENGTRSSLQSKKRKFDELSNLSKSGVYSASNALPLPPALPKSYGQSPRSIGIGGSHVSPVKNRKLQRSEPVVKPRVDTVSDVSPLQEQLEDEDYARLPDIRSSRWATDANSPADEGEIVDGSAGGIQEMRKATSLDDTIEMRVHKTSISPEFGELKTEGSQGSGARSSEYGESGVFSRSRSSSKDDFTDKNLDNNEYMELDGEYNNDGTSLNHTDTYSEDERDSPDMPETTGPPRRSVNMLQGCRNVDEFERLKKVNEGTYGVVYKARDKKTGEIVALKKVKMEREREGFPITSLREINILRSFDHHSIVDVKEVVVGSSMDSIFMVMEYMEYDLKARMDTMKHSFSETEVKRLMLQLLEGVKYLHDNWVLHRDLKTSNLLLNDDNKLKICDFGMARQYGSPLKPYTHLVVTLWYRAPELLLGAKQYSTAVDMWSVGCIMAELLSKQPLFCGKTEIDQLDKIFKVVGTPNETFWPGFSKLPGVKGNFVKHPNNLRKKFPAISCTGAPVLSEAGFDLLSRLLTYSPEKRITADDALRHKWFHEAKGFMPTFPAQHAIGDDCEDYL